MLEKLKAAVEGDEGAQIPKLSSEYYTFIPTMSGRKAPPPLDSLELIGAKEAQLLFWLKMGFEGTSAVAGKTQVDNPLEALWETKLCATLREACALGGPGVSDAGSIASSVARGKPLSWSFNGPPPSAGTVPCGASRARRKVQGLATCPGAQPGPPCSLRRHRKACLPPQTRSRCSHLTARTLEKKKAGDPIKLMDAHKYGAACSAKSASIGTPW